MKSHNLEDFQVGWDLEKYFEASGLRKFLESLNLNIFSFRLSDKYGFIINDRYGRLPVVDSCE